MSREPTYHFREFLAPRYWLTWICLGFAYLNAHLPFGIQQILGRTLGRLMYYLMPKRRHITLTNLRLCFPNKTDAEIRQIAKQSFAEIGLGAIEACVAILGHPEKLASRVKINGEENIKYALSQKRGIIVLGAHFATLELAGYFAKNILPMHATYRPLKNKLIDYFVYRQRKANFKSVIHRNDIRSMVKALKQGDAIWYAPDQDYGRQHSVFAPFFGVSAATVTGLSRLAKMSGAVVLPGFHIRENGGYRFIALPILENFPSGNDEVDARQINAVLEKMIGQYPSQYLWQHRRFKTRPQDEPSVY